MKNTPIVKQLVRSDDYFVQFTDEEMAQLGITPGDKFSCKLEDGGIRLEKYVPLEIDLEDFSKETFVYLAQVSIEQDLTFEEALGEVLKQCVESFADDRD